MKSGWNWISGHSLCFNCDIYLLFIQRTKRKGKKRGGGADLCVRACPCVCVGLCVLRSLFNSVKSEFWRQTASNLLKWRDIYSFIHRSIHSSVRSLRTFFNRTVFPLPSDLSFISLNCVHSVRTVHGWSCQPPPTPPTPPRFFPSFR